MGKCAACQHNTQVAYLSLTAWFDNRAEMEDRKRYEQSQRDKCAPLCCCWEGLGCCCVCCGAWRHAGAASTQPKPKPGAQGVHCVDAGHADGEEAAEEAGAQEEGHQGLWVVSDMEAASSAGAACCGPCRLPTAGAAGCGRGISSARCGSLLTRAASGFETEAATRH